MLVTFTSEVVFPGVDKLMLVFLNHCRNFVQLQQVMPFIFDHFNLGLKPELGLPLRRKDVHMNFALMLEVWRTQ